MEESKLREKIDKFLDSKERYDILFSLGKDDDLVAYIYYVDNREILLLDLVNEQIHDVPNWEISYNSELFARLDRNYQIIYINDTSHYAAWNYILNNYYLVNSNHYDGVKLYLDYCYNHDISQQYLKEKINLNTPDILKLYGYMNVHDVIELNGYIFEVYNIDKTANSCELHIFNGQTDFVENLNYEILNMPLSDLNNSPESYLVEFCKEKSNVKLDASYFAYIFEYEFSNEILNKENVEDSMVHSFSKYVGEEYIKSNNYKTDRSRGFEVFADWLLKNSDYIRGEFEDYQNQKIPFNKIVLQNNLKILHMGKRRDQPIALIEKNFGDNREFVVAFYYQIKDKQVNWGYGHYYRNYNDALSDFKKVILENNFNQELHERGD